MKLFRKKKLEQRVNYLENITDYDVIKFTRQSGEYVLSIKKEYKDSGIAIFVEKQNNNHEYVDNAVLYNFSCYDSSSTETKEEQNKSWVDFVYNILRKKSSRLAKQYYNDHQEYVNKLQTKQDEFTK